MLLNEMTLHNFKGFQEQKIRFKPLTLLAGVNSAGKSSTIQALLLVQQSIKNSDNSQVCLSGELVNLGTWEDVLHSNAEEDTFAVELALNSSSCAIQSTAMSSHKSPLNRLVWDRSKFPVMQYLNAERTCPATLFPVPTSRQLDMNPMGKHGQFAAWHLHNSGHNKIAFADTGASNVLASDAAGTSLLLQTEAWLSQLGDTVRIKTEQPLGTDSVVLQFSFPDMGGVYYRPTNVGFGLTYTLPIIVAGLLAKKGCMLIVENPEAHLHPRGQSTMGQFLARVAACGVQVIIETHSDHVLNGIRVAVKQKVLPPMDVQINFFYHEDGVCKIAEPKIDADGHIDQWPEDFFDEWDKQLAVLL